MHQRLALLHGGPVPDEVHRLQVRARLVVHLHPHARPALQLLDGHTGLADDAAHLMRAGIVERAPIGPSMQTCLHSSPTLSGAHIRVKVTCPSSPVVVVPCRPCIMSSSREGAR
eukprot:scaffold51598_cov13-Tisochrysis_lutea.AAC.2